MYHVDLDLTDGEVRELKHLAISRNISVKDLVTQLTKSAIKQSLTTPEKAAKNKKEGK